MYDFSPEGLVAATARKDIVNITISVKTVIILNLRFSIRVRPG